MLSLKEQAVNIVQSFPDEKMSYVIELLKWVLNILDDNSKASGEMPLASLENPAEATEPTKAVKAWERFKAYKGIIPYAIDAKTELAQARDEKYADFV